MKNLTKLSIQGLFALLFGLLLACGGNQAKKEEGKPGQQMEESKPSAKKYILFFGNSLTAGYGIDISEAFPALIQKRMDSLGLNFTVVNSGVSGETTATGVNRVDWVVSQTPPDIFVLELGGNDGLRGIPVTETKKNLVADMKGFSQASGHFFANRSFASLHRRYVRGFYSDHGSHGGTY